MAPSSTLESCTRSRIRRHAHARRQRRTDVVRHPASLWLRRRADGATHRPTSVRSGFPSAAVTAAGLLATSSSASATMTPCRAALWDQQQQQLATTASYACFWLRHERLRYWRALLRKLTKYTSRRRAGGARQRASTEQIFLRLPGHHEDCCRSPWDVCQSECNHDARSGYTLGSAAAAAGNSSILPFFRLRHERLRSCRVMCQDLWPRCTSASLRRLLDA
ncbi:uncharacterized protein [Dermacentor albipictus]|uniref:uncharacterized protein isoform X1 n=1 Tax=Dermacentor albipictus TaxID=60249 RepID=UPI0038FC9A0F